MFQQYIYSKNGCHLINLLYASKLVLLVYESAIQINLDS